MATIAFIAINRFKVLVCFDMNPTDLSSQSLSDQWTSDIWCPAQVLGETSMASLHTFSFSYLHSRKVQRMQSIPTDLSVKSQPSSKDKVHPRVGLWFSLSLGVSFDLSSLCVSVPRKSCLFWLVIVKLWDYHYPKNTTVLWDKIFGPYLGVLQMWL